MDNEQLPRESVHESKRTVIFVVLVFIILLFGTLGLLYYQKVRYSNVFFEYSGYAVHKVQESGLEKYDIEFFKEGDGQPFVISSRFHPKDLEYIPVDHDLRSYLIGNKDSPKEKLYVTMEPRLSAKAAIAFSEINKYIENPFLFNLPTFPGLIRAGERNDLPVITCKDASETVGVILFEIGDTNQIFVEGECVILEAVDEDHLIQVADRLSLTVLGIMKP